MSCITVTPPLSALLTTKLSPFASSFRASFDFGSVVFLVTKFLMSLLIVSMKVITV